MALTYKVPPKLVRPFKVGDYVGVFSHEGIEISRTIVTRVTTLRVTTKDGRDWDDDGWWLDDGHAYPFPYIRQNILTVL